jgi:hypothetical protein
VNYMTLGNSADPVPETELHRQAADLRGLLAD